MTNAEPPRDEPVADHGSHPARDDQSTLSGEIEAALTGRELPDADGDDAAAADTDADSASHDALEHSHARRMRVPPWIQLVSLPMLVLVTLLFARAASHAVVVFLIALIISLLLSPLVRQLVNVGIPRLVSVLLVFGMFASIVTIITISGVQVLASQAAEVRDNSDVLTHRAVAQVNRTQEFIDRRGWNIDLRDQGVQAIETLQERSTELSGRALELGRELVTFAAAAAFNVVLIIVISIYMLLDAPRIGRFISGMLPRESGVEVLYARLEHTLLRYAIGQSLASLVMGASAAIGLYVMGATGVWETGKQYALLFGLFVAVTEFAPSIGPVVGAIPPVALALFDGVGPAVAVTVFFVLLHQIEGHIVVPKLMGAAIAVHPLLVIFGILAGAQIMGVGGVLLALPLLAICREVLLFVRERTYLARWPRREDALP